MYGGMPYTLNLNSHEQKSLYLNSLFVNTYVKDIIERYNIQRTELLNGILDFLASSIGSLTNPTNISNEFYRAGYATVNNKTIDTYIQYLNEAFLIETASRYDIKGKKMISTPKNIIIQILD